MALLQVRVGVLLPACEALQLVGSSAHPTRIALDTLPEQHPARLAAAVVDPEEPELPAAPVADADRNDTAEKTASLGVAA